MKRIETSLRVCESAGLRVKRDMKRIVILGSTGSVGRNTLDVIEAHSDRFEVAALSGHRNLRLLRAQARRLNVKDIVLTSREGSEGRLIDMVRRDDVDMVVIANTSISSLRALLAAIEAKKQVALANKELLVMAGELIMQQARAQGVVLLPIDSEHSAIFQCLNGRDGDSVRKIYLTGSGGPLLNVSKKRFDSLPCEFVLAHPQWKMGKKISVDSATLMNKGLEVIEAHWLFDMSVTGIEVLIHPESIIHSMVEFVDGALLAQLAVCDMRLPIQYALSYPERLVAAWPSIDFARARSLTFEPPDLGRFPCLALAYEAAKLGGTAPAVLNASDELCVEAYLNGEIKISAIPRIIERVLRKHRASHPQTLDEVLNVDRWARGETRCYL